jgi:hypothetical protein
MPSSIFQSYCLTITTYPDLTGDHRWIICCNNEKQRACVTGPQKDIWVQLWCFFGFGITGLAWGLLSGFLIWQANAGLVIINCAIWITALAFFFATTFTDPGVLPKNLLPVTPEQERDPLFCRNCRIVRPLGAHHCSHCESCCLELDHHCGVVGQCIGARNKTWFGGLVGCINHFWWHSFMAIIFGISYAVAPTLQPSNVAFNEDSLRIFQGFAWGCVFISGMIYLIMVFSIVSLARCPTRCCAYVVSYLVFGSSSPPRQGLFHTDEARQPICNGYCGPACTEPISRVYDTIQLTGNRTVGNVPTMVAYPLSSSSSSASPQLLQQLQPQPTQSSTSIMVKNSSTGIPEMIVEV